MPTTISGLVSDILNNAHSPDGKILNAINFPACFFRWDDNLSLATNVVAWDYLQGKPYCSNFTNPYSTGICICAGDWQKLLPPYEWSLERWCGTILLEMHNPSMCDEPVTCTSLLWHPHKIETWGTQFEHLCKTVNRTIYIISTILQKDLFYFILLPSKQSVMSNFPAKMMPQNWIL